MTESERDKGLGPGDWAEQKKLCLAFSQDSFWIMEGLETAVRISNILLLRSFSLITLHKDHSPTKEVFFV